MYIRIADLDKYGYTLGCDVCDAMRAGQRRIPGTHHSQECRDRIEKCMVDDDDPNERLTEAFVKREAEQEAERARAEKAQRTEAPSAEGSASAAGPSAGSARPAEDEEPGPAGKRRKAVSRKRRGEGLEEPEAKSSLVEDDEEAITGYLC